MRSNVELIATSNRQVDVSSSAILNLMVDLAL
jgi:hypothetical protein